MAQYGYSNNTSARSNPQNQDPQATQQEQVPVVDGKVDLNQLRLPKLEQNNSKAYESYRKSVIGGAEADTLSEKEIMQRAQKMFDAGLDGTSAWGTFGQDFDNSVVIDSFTKTIETKDGESISGIPVSSVEIEKIKSAFLTILKRNGLEGDFDQALEAETWGSHSWKSSSLNELRHFTTNDTNQIYQDLKSAMANNEHVAVKSILENLSPKEMQELAMIHSNGELTQEEANKEFLARVAIYQKNNQDGAPYMGRLVGDRLAGISTEDYSAKIAGDVFFDATFVPNLSSENRTQYIYGALMMNKDGSVSDNLSVNDAEMLVKAIDKFDELYGEHVEGGSFEEFARKNLTPSAMSNIKAQLQRAQNVIGNNEVLEGVNAEVERLKEKYGEDSLTKEQKEKITSIQEQLKDPDIERGLLDTFPTEIANFEGEIQNSLDQDYIDKESEFNKLAAELITQGEGASMEASEFMKSLGTPIAKAIFDVSAEENKALRENNTDEKSATKEIREQLAQLAEEPESTAEVYQDKFIDGLKKLEETYPETYALLKEGSIDARYTKITRGQDEDLQTIKTKIESELVNIEQDILDSRKNTLAHILLNSDAGGVGLDISEINYREVSADEDKTEFNRRRDNFERLYDGLRGLYEAGEKTNEKITYFNEEKDKNTSSALEQGVKNLVPQSIEHFSFNSDRIIEAYEQEIKEREELSYNVKENYEKTISEYVKPELIEKGFSPLMAEYFFSDKYKSRAERIEALSFLLKKNVTENSYSKRYNVISSKFDLGEKGISIEDYKERMNNLDQLMQICEEKFSQQQASGRDLKGFYTNNAPSVNQQFLNNYFASAAEYIGHQ